MNCLCFLTPNLRLSAHTSDTYQYVSEFTIFFTKRCGCGFLTWYISTVEV